MALSFKQSLAYFWEQIGKQFVKNGTIDWAQNDETKSGYIKNRTHYIGFEETGESFKNVHSDGLFNIAIDDSISAAAPVPPGYYGYMGYVNASSKLFDESSDVTGFKVTWEGKTYYSKILNEFEDQQIMFGNVDIFISMLEYIQGTTLPPEMRNEVPELAMHNMPFFGVLSYEPIDGVSIQLFTNKNFGDWVPIKVDILTGDGEIEKLNNIYLDENVVITNSEQSSIIAGPFLVPMDDPDASESSYLLLSPPVINFEKNKTYYITINNETFCSIPTLIEQDGTIVCYFGNFTGINDAPEDVYNSPEANYYGMYARSDTMHMMVIIPREGAEITSSLTVTIAEGVPDNAWLARDKNGNIYWEEKTHGIIKGDGQVIVPVQEYTLEELEGLMLTQWPQLQEGARYSITFGTATWETVCSTLSNDGIQAHILGDIQGVMNGQDGIVSDPPIVIVQLPVAIDEGMYNLIEFDPDFNVGDVLSGESVRFGITKCDSIKKLDSKYIDWPDTIPVLSEKDGNVYGEASELVVQGEHLGRNVYKISGNLLINCEVGAYYTVVTDSDSKLLQCGFYQGDIDMPGILALVDDASTLDSLMAGYMVGSFAVACVPTRNETMIYSALPITYIQIRDKQTYLNKINTYALHNNLPLVGGSGIGSIQSSTLTVVAEGLNSIALNQGATAVGTNSIAIGSQGSQISTRAVGNDSIAIGFGSHSIGEKTYAFNGGLAYGTASLAINGIAGGTNSVAINTDAEYGSSVTYTGLTGERNTTTYSCNYQNGDAPLYPGLIITTYSSFSYEHINTIDNLDIATIVEIVSIENGRYTFKTDKTLNKYSDISNAQFYVVKGAFGENSYAIGSSAITNGRSTVALPYSTALAEGAFAYSRGVAYGEYSVASAMGVASGTMAYAHGMYSHADGIGSFAFGSLANASGMLSLAHGENVTATGELSRAYGSRATAKGSNACAEGWNTIASGENQHVLGRKNIEDTENKYAFIIGNGINNESSNALTVNWNGNTWVKGSLFVGGTSETEGASKVATEAYVNGLIVPPVLESTAGKENAAGPIGKYASGTPGMNSFTWGVEALAAGAGSIAMGTSSTTSSSAHWGVAIGTYAASKGGGAVAIGQNVTASNENAVAIGHGATASSLHSIAIGNNLTANHNNQVVLGTYNVSANYSLLLGNGSGSGRSNAFGVTNTGTGYFAGDLYVNGTGTSSTFSNAKKVATESYVDTKVANLVDSAPTTLNTLNELAAALGDDPNFATTVATEIGKKADKTDLVALTEAEILEVCGVAAVAHVSEVTW